MQNLHIDIVDNVSRQAFISALLYFDNETDSYIVSKYLEIGNKINIESFFNFRLQSLKQKWQELVDISNQNEIYLYKDDIVLNIVIDLNNLDYSFDFVGVDEDSLGDFSVAELTIIDYVESEVA